MKMARNLSTGPSKMSKLQSPRQRAIEVFLHAICHDFLSPAKAGFDESKFLLTQGCAALRPGPHAHARCRGLDREAVTESSRGQSALFARRPRLAIFTKRMDMGDC